MTFYVENEVNHTFDFDMEEIARMVAKDVLQSEACPFETEINLLLTDNEGIREFNDEFRHIDQETDVLSFPMFERNEIDAIIKEEQKFQVQEVLGDIMISIQRVEQQAKEYGHSFERELAYMLIHGFYHLMGYDHMNEEEKKEMRAKEEKVLNLLNIKR